METISGLIGPASRRLEAATGMSRGRPAVEALLAQILGTPVSWLYAHPETIPTAEQAQRFLHSLQQLVAGVPLEYLMGRAGFYGIELALTADVLVPRPETETLVELAIARLQGVLRPRIADVGTGSGAIALALAAALPDAVIVATEISPAALRVAARNVQAQRQEERVLLVNGDLLESVSGPFDLVAANLPYVSDADLEGPAGAVARYEPRLALAGGSDGLELVRRLLAQLPGRVRSGGWALLEIGAGQAKEARRAATIAAPAATADIVADAWGRDRVLALRFSP